MTFWSRLTVLAVPLVAAVAAVAKEPTPPPPSADDAVPIEQAQPQLPGVEVDAPAEEMPTGGIWAWVERMDGEVLSEQALAAIEERSEARFDEGALIDSVGAVDVPTEVYADPVKATEVDPLHLAEIDLDEFDIPVVVNNEVKKWMRYFLGNGRKHYARYLRRSSRYTPMMYAELEERGLPRDMIYLAMIESGYNAHAYSRVGAAGLWQFMPSTGRLYKLRVDWWVDDRRDPHKATLAAAALLIDLHKMFKGDWYLAWSAYNAGPGRVRRAQRAGNTKDFWVMSRGRHLPSETSNYVPKMLAAAIIGHHPERYGFTQIKYERELTYDEVKVDGSVDLGVLATCAGIDLEAFQYLNPALRRWATPPEGYSVRVPKGRARSFGKALAKVPVHKRVSLVHHRVSKGETLSIIAKKYSVGVAELVRVNELQNANRIYVGMKLVVPRGSDSAPVAASSSSSSGSAKRPNEHRVAKGETLSGIASKYKLSVSQLQGWNSLKGSTIQPGQVLALRAAKRSDGDVVTYTVKRGDTLSGIAARYGVGTAELAKQNDLGNASAIRVGQQLRVRLASTGWTQVTVKRGDSLGLIATRMKCTVGDLKEWNKLTSSVIHPGQELRVRR